MSKRQTMKMQNYDCRMQNGILTNNRYLIMKIKLYNTLTRGKEEFKPIKKGQVKMYVCGPTVYNYAHIGNLSSFIRWDILRRIFKYNHYKIKEVMNITDVDDKTIRDTQKYKMTLKKFTEKYTKYFFDDLKTLNIEKAEIYPKATEHIKEMVILIQKLLDKKVAYKTKDGIYFSISKFKDYGKLACLDLENLKAGASCRVRSDEYDKENMNDFILWKFWDKKDGEVFWNTKIGKGRPGWHIECSAMSSKYLSQPFDIHTGGVDLIFPHHENEIAQSEAATGEKFVNYWLHSEHLLVDNTKMSKSKHNFYTLCDIKNKDFSPLVFRYLVFSSHYRKKLNFTWESLRAAQNALAKLRNEVSNLRTKELKNGKTLKSYKNKFLQAINNDMNTPWALAVVWEVVKSNEHNEDKYATLLDFDKVLGFGLDKIKEEKIPQNILDKVKTMDETRDKKDFKLADKIRKEIESKGYLVQNKKNGSIVEKT